MRRKEREVSVEVGIHSSDKLLALVTSHVILYSGLSSTEGTYSSLAVKCQKWKSLKYILNILQNMLFLNLTLAEWLFFFSKFLEK